MTTREEALKYGLSLPNTYKDAPFQDENWQLVRVRGARRLSCGRMSGMGL